jgi:hypothetical protein
MFRKEMYFIPVIMILKVSQPTIERSLSFHRLAQMLADENTADREIHASLMRGAYKNNTAFDK